MSGLCEELLAVAAQVIGARHMLDGLLCEHGVAPGLLTEQLVLPPQVVAALDLWKRCIVRLARLLAADSDGCWEDLSALERDGFVLGAEGFVRTMSAQVGGPAGAHPVRYRAGKMRGLDERASMLSASRESR